LRGEPAHGSRPVQKLVTAIASDELDRAGAVLADEGGEQCERRGGGDVELACPAAQHGVVAGQEALQPRFESRAGVLADLLWQRERERRRLRSTAVVLVIGEREPAAR